MNAESNSPAATLHRLHHPALPGAQHVLLFLLVERRFRQSNLYVGAADFLAVQFSHRLSRQKYKSLGTHSTRETRCRLSESILVFYLDGIVPIFKVYKSVVLDLLDPVDLAEHLETLLELLFRAILR